MDIEQVVLTWLDSPVLAIETWLPEHGLARSERDELVGGAPCPAPVRSRRGTPCDRLPTRPELSAVLSVPDEDAQLPRN